MTYTDSFAALADPTRRKVLECLSKGPRAVGEIAADLPVSRPAVSQHLKVLSDAGLVHVRAQGTKRIYAVRPEGLESLRRYLDQFWGDVLQNFAQSIQTEGSKNE
ncbi:MAG: metalloregulator ArsR/SmtB family transcription factor [Aliishimia sp.]